MELSAVVADEVLVRANRIVPVKDLRPQGPADQLLRVVEHLPIVVPVVAVAVGTLAHFEQHACRGLPDWRLDGRRVAEINAVHVSRFCPKAFEEQFHLVPRPYAQNLVVHTLARAVDDADVAAVLGQCPLMREPHVARRRACGDLLNRRHAAVLEIAREPGRPFSSRRGDSA